MEKEEIYLKLIQKFGVENQSVVAVEELSELQKEVCKMLRKIGNVHNLAEEIADTLIVIEQLMLIHDCESEVVLLKQQKLQRVYERYLKQEVQNV